jgi:hypothetical protein
MKMTKYAIITTGREIYHFTSMDFSLYEIKTVVEKKTDVKFKDVYCVLRLGDDYSIYSDSVIYMKGE